MTLELSTEPALRAELAELRARLEEAEETLRAIRAGEVDALVVEGDAGLQLFTLQGLEAEQNRLRGEMLAQVSEAVITTDRDDHITYLNLAAEQQYRVRNADMLGRKSSELYTPQWPTPEAEAAAWAALEERGHWCGEKLHRTRDGRVLPVEASIAILHDPETGERAGLIEATRDITERKQVEDALRESEARMGGILRQSPLGIVQTDTDGRMTLVNPRWCEMLGYPEVELLGKTVFDVTHPASVAPTLEAVSRLVAGGPDFQIEKNYIRQDGSLFDAQSNVTALRSPSGEFLGLIAVVQDISERLRAEAALRLTNERLTLAVKCSQVVLFQQDLELRYTWLQNAVPGFDDSHAIGKRDADLMERAADATLAEALKREVIRSGVSQRQEILLQIAGVGRHYDLLVEPLLDAAGLISGITGAATDITERKRAEEARHELERNYRALAAASSEVAYRMSADWSTMLPLDGRQLVASSDQPLADWAWLDQNIPLDEHPRVRTAIREAIARKTLFELEHRVRRPDGSVGWTLSRAVPILDEHEAVIAWFGAANDITERKRVEEALQANKERMRLANAATGVGIWERNVITNAIRWDAQMFQIYGVPPTADGLVSYETWSRAVLPEDLARQEEVLADTVHRLGNSTREFRILRADNRECRWIQSVETVRANEEGKAEWMVGTNLDVTARTNAERAIREEAQRKDEFLAMLGHELRNPLNAIRHAVQIGVEAPENREACQWAASVIDRQSQQLSRMVDDLLDVARINRGRIELRSEALDLGPVLERAIAVVSPLFAGRRQTFTSDIGSQLRVTGDAPRLEQVFVNLLTNAAKYTPDNGLISLHARNENGEVVVAITDNGAGISPELLPRIFDLFRQADSTLDRALGGLGIGLNVVKSLVEMHFGRVTVESAGTHAGTTATVRLPSLLEWPVVGSPPAAPVHDATLPRPVRVLIVDDHIDAAETLELLLQLRGCETRCANSGPAGVAAAREFRPEVLLLDLGLPGLDGYEVARILRAEAPFADALFIAISGYAQDGDRQRCLVSGFDDHFPKPFDLLKLLQVIHSRPYQERGNHGHFPPCAPVGGPP